MPRTRTAVFSTLGTQYRRVPRIGTLMEIKLGRRTLSRNEDGIMPELFDAIKLANRLGQRVTAVVSAESLVGSTSSLTVSFITINGKLTNLGHDGDRGDGSKHSQHMSIRDFYRTTRQPSDPTLD